MENATINLQVDASPEMRIARMADTFMVKTNGACSTIDFISTDGIPDENGTISAILSSRVSMSNEALLALRDMINSHTQTWKTDRDDA